jgi:ankyrin repeat protein/beta-lactamase regulating signal transducer with metallopeptidase domain
MSDILYVSADVVTDYLLVGSVTALVLTVLAWLIIKAGRVGTPVYRHTVWLYCLIGIGVLPALWLYAPKLTLAVLPAQSRAADFAICPEPLPRSEITPAPDMPAEPTDAPQPTRIAGDTSSSPWKTSAAGVWVMGFAFMVVRLAVGWYRLRHVRRAATAAPPRERLPGANRRKPPVLLSSELEGPACFGVFRPVVLLPRDMYEGATPRDLHMVLAHEFAHIERGDCWANLLQRIVEAAFFFHPLVWLASRRLTQQREHICDNYVLADGASPDDYTTLLSHIGERALGQISLPTVALFEGQLLSRVRSLLDPLRSRKTRLPLRAAIACTLTVLVAFVVFGCVRLGAKAGDPAMARSQAPAVSLHEAVKEGDMKQVKALIAAGADVSKENSNGATPLHVAAGNGRTAIAALLIDQGANVNEQKNNKWTETPLHYATWSGHEDVAELLVAKGANVNARDENQQTPLHFAATRGHAGLAQLFIARRADVDATDDNQRTPLHFAAKEDHKELAQILITHGADLTLTDRNGQSPLDTAMVTNHRPIVEFFVSKGLEPSILIASYLGDLDEVKDLVDDGSSVNGTPTSPYWHSPLHVAAIGGQRHVAEFLIAKGANVNAVDKNDWTALHLAAIHDHKDVGELIIAKGADVDARNIWGGTPLHQAARYGATEMVELLLAKGADVNVHNKSGLTPLHMAGENSGTEVPRLLLANGADLNARMNRSLTPLHYAVIYEQRELVELLIDEGADINAQTDTGVTPLYVAASRGSREMIELLISRGADVNITTSTGETAASMAQREGHQEIVELLRNHRTEE